MLTFSKYPQCGAQSDCIAILPAVKLPPSFLNAKNERGVQNQYKDRAW